MLIPTDAVYYEGGKSMVYTLVDGKVEERPVEVGVYDSEKSEIKDGLSLEDDVIVTWSSELFAGSEVKVAESDGAEESAAAGTEAGETAAAGTAEAGTEAE